MTIDIRWRSIFAFVIATCLVISPFLMVPLASGAAVYDNQRLIEIFGGILALAVISCHLMSGSPIPLLFSRPIAIPLVLFFSLGFISSVTAYSPRHAFFDWANLLLLLGIAWLIAWEVSIRKDELLDKLLMVCGLAAAVYLLITILLYIVVLKVGIQPSTSQLIVGYDNYRFFNHVQTISLPLLGLLAARMPDRGRRIFWWVITALWWMLLFVGFGRGTLMGLTVAIAIAWYTMPKVAGAWCRTMALAGVAGLIAYLFFYWAIPWLLGMEPFGLLFSSLSRTVESPTSGRLLLWARAVEMMLADPWLGGGPAHFAHYGRDIPYGAHPHSWVLQIGSEWGIPALLLLSGALALAMLRLWQLRKIISAANQDTLTAWLVAGAAISVDGFVSGLIVIPTSQLWIALYVGCAWGWTRSLSPAVKTIDRKRSAGVRIMAIMAAFLMTYPLVHLTWHELRDIQSNPYSKEVTYRPRIFLDGDF
ncbi:MAG: O-antigen ligase family protein [Polaromonas sp.]|uniref:O-antigen ligase family protein n=1 Tax=Polaromonas sp. TaxID=1869339 RepID=UPI00273469BF|nr:O-antigen ligase family protein [Polaromonas sp.]MDP3796296.1 O-antigen ligase family protein [Polaromonas sp.]